MSSQSRSFQPNSTNSTNSTNTINSATLSSMYKIELTGPDITPSEENTRWSRYEDQYNQFVRESDRMIENTTMCFHNIIRWIDLSPDSQDYQHVLQISRAINQIGLRMGSISRPLTDPELIARHRKTLVDKLEMDYQIQNDYTDKMFLVRRKRTQYGLRYRGISRDDIPLDERFGVTQVEFLFDFYTQSISKLRTNLFAFNHIKHANSADENVVRACDMSIEYFTNLIQKTTREIGYYRGILDEYSSRMRK